MSASIEIGNKKWNFAFQGAKLIYPNYKGNPILHYDFLDMKNDYVTRGIAQDLSGNGNNGSLQNFGYEEGSGYQDKGLQTDGVDDRILFMPSLNMPSDKWTIETTFKAKVGNRRVLSYGEIIRLGLTSGGNIQTQGTHPSMGDVVNTGVSLIDKVVKISIVYSSTMVEIYLNGISVFSRATTASNLFGLTSIGSYGTFYFEGSIYNVALFPTALTPSEILHNYNIDKARFNIL